MATTAGHITQISRQIDPLALITEVRNHIDESFADLPILTGHAASNTPVKRGKKRRTLDYEVTYWENKANAAHNELGETRTSLPQTLQSAQERLAKLLRQAQEISLQRYALADKLATLIGELDSSRAVNDEKKIGDHTVMERMEQLQLELGRLEAGLVWVNVLEQVVLLSEKTLDGRSHHPSPLAALPTYTDLHRLVEKVTKTLPGNMGLVGLVREIRDKTWKGLKDIMSKHLLDTLEPLKWPVKVDYPSVSPDHRRAFERAYTDLLYLQAEGENLGADSGKKEWSEGAGLYPLQAMVQPIALRFRYHFQGKKDTNRVDKPEWAFTSILDRIYEHSAFISEYLEPLTRRAGYMDIDVKSEFILLLLPILLGMLKSRIPHILDSPALLAHTIYQTVIFDDAVRESGFDFDHVWINDGVENAEWEGLAGLVLKESGWFDRWLAGEKKFAEGQLQEILSSQDAWSVSEETDEADDGMSEEGLKPTTSARQVKALIEQVTDRYSPLPSLQHRIPFLTLVQLPILASYLSRISGSLDAFESLSSAFVRAVPGALSGNTRSGVHIDQTKLTTGKAGLERLIKACLSASYILTALRLWSDEIFFVEMSEDLRHNYEIRRTVKDELLLPSSIRLGGPGAVFDVLIERYEVLEKRSEEMMVRQVSAEVENDLKQHLKRRWDRTEGEAVPDTSLLHGLTTYADHLSTLSLLPDIPRSRVYRKIVNHLTNHIYQRAVFAGWSKFTVLGGNDLKQEIIDWVNTSQQVDLPGGESAVKAPWRGLEDSARVLNLPNEGEGEEVTFGQAMAVAWSDSAEGWEGFKERSGWSGDGEALKAVLRRRVECWR